MQIYFLNNLIHNITAKLENNYYLCSVKKEKSYGRGGFFTLLCLISRKNGLNQCFWTEKYIN